MIEKKLLECPKYRNEKKHLCMSLIYAIITLFYQLFFISFLVLKIAYGASYVKHCMIKNIFKGNLKLNVVSWRVATLAMSNKEEATYMPASGQ